MLASPCLAFFLLLPIFYGNTDIEIVEYLSSFWMKMHKKKILPVIIYDCTFML
jgi:hypothetical protein